MIPANKIILTEEQDAYLRENYATVINYYICKELGISMRTLVRLARERGLEKDMVAIEGQRRRRMSESIRKTLRARGSKNSSLNGIETRFKKGYKPKELFGEEKFNEMHRKAVETRKKRFAEDRARYHWGLPQKSNMHVSRQPRQKIQDRCYLKKRGYIIDDTNNTAYYTSETRRAIKMESWPRRFYYFKPYEQH